MGLKIVKSARYAFLVGLLFALIPAGSAHADPSLCTYVEDRNLFGGSPTGHAFIQMLPDTGPDAGRRDLLYGFHPKIAWRFAFGSPGEVKSELNHGWTWKICHTISPAAYDATMQRIRADILNPPEYVFLKFNCTDWAYKIARGAGVSLPSATILGWVFDPAQLASKLKAIFIRGQRTFNGGRIFLNSAKQHPQDSLDLRAKARRKGRGGELEGTESALDIVNFAFRRPVATARGLDLSVHRSILPQSRLGAGRQLRLSLGAVGPKASLTEVRFGDGTHKTLGRRFAHRYRRPGHYRLRGIAIANAVVYRFELPIEVDRSRDGAAIRTRAPHGHPHPDGFPILMPPVISTSELLPPG